MPDQRTCGRTTDVLPEAVAFCRRRRFAVLRNPFGGANAIRNWNKWTIPTELGGWREGKELKSGIELENGFTHKPI